MNTRITACAPVNISDDDVIEAMKDMHGYLDITSNDFKELYQKAYQHAVRRLIESVKVRDVMTTDVVYATEGMPLSEVAELMAANQISGLPVLNKEIVTGVISEKDFLFVMSKGAAGTFMGVIRECLLGRSCLAAPVRMGKAADIMSSPVTTVQDDTPILEAATLMSTRGINRLPVVDSAGKLRGIVTRSDALSWSVSV